MATLSSLATTVENMIQRSDQTANIKTEIANAVRHYSRRASWVIERRGGTITTSAGTTWYSTIDNTAGAGIESSPSGTTPTSSDSLINLLSINYARIEQGTTDWPLSLVAYSQFESLLENTSVQGTPRYITFYAGRIGLWPTPDGAHTIYISAFFKPSAPSADTDESVWFEQYPELIENAAAARVAIKWLQDTEMAAMFRAEEKEQEKLMMAEGAIKSTTGRTMPTRF